MKTLSGLLLSLTSCAILLRTKPDEGLYHLIGPAVASAAGGGATADAAAGAAALVDAVAVVAHASVTSFAVSRPAVVIVAAAPVL